MSAVGDALSQHVHVGCGEARTAPYMHGSFFALAVLLSISILHFFNEGLRDCARTPGTCLHSFSTSENTEEKVEKFLDPTKLLDTFWPHSVRTANPAAALPGRRVHCVDRLVSVEL